MTIVGIAEQPVEVVAVDRHACTLSVESAVAGIVVPVEGCRIDRVRIPNGVYNITLTGSPIWLPGMPVVAIVIVDDGKELHRIAGRRGDERTGEIGA